MFFVYPIRQADSTGPFHVTNERSPTRGFGPISGRAGQREPRHRRAAELAYCHVITGRRYWQRTRPQQEERINNQPPESILSRHPGQFVERLCKYLPMLLWSRSPDLSLHRPSCLALIAPHLLFSLGVPLLTPETNQYRSSYFFLSSLDSFSPSLALLLTQSRSFFLSLDYLKRPFSTRHHERSY